MSIDLFDVVSVERLKRIAESANKVGILGRCSVFINGEYDVSFAFELDGCFEAALISANDDNCYDTSKDLGSDKTKPYDGGVD